MGDHKQDTAYLDESGDPGANGSEYLITSLWCTPPYKKISKIIRKAKQQLLRNKKHSRWLSQRGGEIKYSGFPDDHLLRKTLRELSKLDSHLFYFAYKKQGKTLTRENKNFVVLNSLFTHKDDFGSVPKKIIADVDYFSNNKISYCISRIIKNEKEGRKIIELMNATEFKNAKIDEGAEISKVEHHNSKMSDELQALDLLSGAIFCKFERKDEDYFKIINSDKIKIHGKEVL